MFSVFTTASAGWNAGLAGSDCCETALLGKAGLKERPASDVSIAPRDWYAYERQGFPGDYISPLEE